MTISTMSNVQQKIRCFGEARRPRMIPPALIARASIPHDVDHGSSSSPCQSNRPAALILPQTKSFSELLSRTRFSALSYRGRSFVPAGSGQRAEADQC